MREVKVFLNVEKNDFKIVESAGKKSVKLEGIAMPLNKMSRNGVFYRPESVKKNYKTMEKSAFLFNHDTSISLGHVESVDLNEEAMTYVADLDPSEQEYINKVERGDIRHVSIGAIVENPEFNEDGTVTVDVKEFVELSLVPVPGFKDATANRKELSALVLKEAFDMKEEAEPEKTEEPKEQPVEQPVEEQKVEDPQSPEAHPEPETPVETEELKDKSEDEQEKEDLKLKIKELEEKSEEFNNRLAIIESRIDIMEEKNKENIDEEEDEEDSEVEEKIKRVNLPVVETKTKVINLNERRLSNLSY